MSTMEPDEGSQSDAPRWEGPQKGAEEPDAPRWEGADEADDPDSADS